MRYRYLLLALCTVLVLGGCSDSNGSSAPDSGQDTDIGLITKPKAEAPRCIEPVQTDQDDDADIGIITKPDTDAPTCIEPVQPSPVRSDSESVDVEPLAAPVDSEPDRAASPCPVDMVPIGETSCLDRFEASRPDATAVSKGTNTSQATSRAGVLPWYPVDITMARAACAAAGKRLCKEDELRTACRGPADTTYTYGNTYAPETCNGIDTYCDCDSASCADAQPCPYPGCYNRDSAGAEGGGCGAALRVMPTGSFPGCVNEYGAFDLSGNVWELVDRGTDESWYMGGAFNCLDSEALHRCDSLQQDVSARGFRCCAEQEPLR